MKSINFSSTLDILVYEVREINNLFAGPPKRILLRYGTWEKIFAEYFTEITLFQIY